MFTPLIMINTSSEGNLHTAFRAHSEVLHKYFKKYSRIYVRLMSNPMSWREKIYEVYCFIFTRT